MNVLHAHWQPPQSPAETGTFSLWSETTDSPPPTAKIDRRARTARPHPFAGEAADLPRQIVALTGLHLPGTAASLSLRLPTLRTAPQPSPHLTHNWDLDNATPVLLPWQMPCRTLAPADALFLLLNLPSANDLPHDVRLGDDLLFWQVAARLALETLAQQKVHPALVADADGKSLYARWLPVLDGPRDGPRLARLRQAMPPLCRAAAEGETQPHALLDSFLAGLTDDLMRRWNRGSRVAQSAQTDGAAWLNALCQDDAAVQISPAQARRLLSSYGAWLRSLHVAGDGNFRLADSPRLLHQPHHIELGLESHIAAVDGIDAAGDIGRFVAGQIDDKRGDGLGSRHGQNVQLVNHPPRGWRGEPIHLGFSGDKAGADTIDAYPVGANPGGERTGKSHHTPLGCGVRVQPGSADEGIYGGGQNHRPGALLAHLSAHILGAQKCAGEMDVQHPLPSRFGQVKQAAVLGVDEVYIRRAVIEYVNAAKCCYCLRHQRLHLGAVGHIDPRDPGLSTRRNN